jgi:hypothetical protein
MQNNKRIINYIDQTSEKGHHMVFNSSMIKVLQICFPQHHLLYWGIDSNQQATLELLDTKNKLNCTLKTLHYKNTKRSFVGVKLLFFLNKEITRAKNFHSILKYASPNDTLFLSITTFSSFLVFKYLHYFNPKPTVAVLHGDIDFLYLGSSKLEKLNAWCHKRIFKIKSSQFKYIVLNKLAKERLCADGYLGCNEVIEINHPFANLNQNYPPLSVVSPIKLGHIGSMEVARKNSHLLYKIAEMFKNEVKSKQLCFETIGLITPNVIPFKNNWVLERVGNTKPNQPDYLTRTEYEKYLSELHFTLFFIDKQQYIFRTSGAIIDTIAFQKPIIAFKHPYFDYLISQVGPIGYFVDTIDQMAEVLHTITHAVPQTASDYSLFTNNLAQLKELFGVQSVAADLAQQLNNNN